MPQKKLVLLLPYFGEPVRWMDFFLASCARNPGIDWYIVSDFDIPHRPANVLHMKVPLDAYLGFVQHKLGLSLEWTDAYKLCDLKPALGLLHHEITRQYEFWGYTDMDLVYGDVLGPYTPFMDEFDVISSHTCIAAGHLMVFRTMDETLTLFSRYPHWREKFNRKTHEHYDERHVTHLLMPKIKHSNLRFAERFVTEPEVGGKKLKVLFKEQFTTYNGEDWLLPGGRLAQPTEWTWDEGVLSNDVMGPGILYGHFSHWNSGRWGNVESGHAGAWKSAGPDAFPKRPYDEIRKFTVSHEGFRIDD